MKACSHILALLCLPGLLAAAAPGIGAVTKSGASVGQYEKFELTFPLSTVAANLYDPAQADVRVTFTSPSGTAWTVAAFPYQAYTRSGSRAGQALTPSGGIVWKARFAPAMTGSWSYLISATDAGGSSTSANGSPFSVTASTNPGFVRRSASDPRYFVRDDGSGYFPVGENVAWAGTGRTYDYDQWFADMAAQGGNFARVWMAAWGMSVDWDDNHSNTYLGNYANRQGQAWELDYVMDLARAQGVYIQLCLLHHGMFSSTTNPNWPDNIYSSAWGGPLTNPQDLWTNAAAKALMKRRWRYITARWGYSTQVFAWEFWNEMEWTDQFAANAANAAAWHSEMAADLRSRDVNGHLITTSLANYPGDAAIFASGDIAQVHHYNGHDLADVSRGYAAGVMALNPGKAYLLGEVGPDQAGNTDQAYTDPTGLSVHETQWANLMSGAGGAGFPWWWDYWFPVRNLYGRHKGVAGFTAGETLPGHGYVPITPTCATATRTDLTWNGALGWGTKASANLFSIDAGGGLSPDTSSMASVLYCATSNAQYRNPPTFHVTCPSACQFRVNVVDNGNWGAMQLSVKLDGVTVLTQAVPLGPQNNTYSVAVPAGTHDIFVDSTGSDWLGIGGFSLTQFVPLLRCYALKGSDRVLGWVQSRNNTYWGRHQGLAQPTLSDGQVLFSGLNNGSWSVQWWDSAAGTQVSTASGVAVGGAMALAVPQIDAVNGDRAFKMSWTGAGPTATPSITPTRSATPSATATATRTGSPTPSQTPSASGTASTTPTATPSATATPSQTATMSPTTLPAATGTSTATATAAWTPSATPSPSQADTSTASFTPSPSPSMSHTPTQTPAFSATATPSLSPQPTGSLSPSLPPTPSMTASATAAATATVSSTPTASLSVTENPGATATSSPTLMPAGTDTCTATATCTLPFTGTPTQTSTALDSATATPSFSPSVSPSATVTGLASATSSATALASTTPSVTPGPSSSVTQALSSPTATPTPQPMAVPALDETGVLALLPWPNPGPGFFLVKLKGPADAVSLTVYSKAWTKITGMRSDALPAGWSHVPVPASWGRELPADLYYVVAQARAHDRVEGERRVQKMLWVH